MRLKSPSEPGWTTAVVLCFFALPACKTRQDVSSAHAKEYEYQPSVKISVERYVLGQGYRSGFNLPTSMQCVEEGSAGASLVGVPSSEADGRLVAAELFGARRPDDLRPAREAGARPKVWPLLTPEDGRDGDLFAPNEFVASTTDGMNPPSDSDSSLTVTNDPAGGRALGLAGDSSPDTACGEPAIKAWRAAVEAAFTAKGGGKAPPITETKTYLTTSLDGLRKSLKLDADAAIKALGQSAANETKMRMALNYEAESQYFSTDSTVFSDDRREISNPKATAKVGASWDAAKFYDECGDRYISARVLGARYQQYYLMTRSSLERSESFSSTTTVKLRLGPLRATRSAQVSWEFAESNKLYAAENRRYVAGPWLPDVKDFPETMACMAALLQTLPKSVAASESGKGKTVGFDTRAYGSTLGPVGKRTSPAAEDIAKREQVVGRYLKILDDMAKYAGALKNVLDERFMYAKIPNYAPLQAKLEHIVGKPYSLEMKLDPEPSAGLIGEISDKGRALTDAYLRNQVPEATLNEQLIVWRKEIDAELLPDRIVFAMLSEERVAPLAEARAFCDKLTVAKDSPTLGLLREKFPGKIWRLPRAAEAQAMRHGIDALYAGMPEGSFPGGKRRIYVFTIEEDRSATPGTIDAGGGGIVPLADPGAAVAAPLCIFASANL